MNGKIGGAIAYVAMFACVSTGRAAEPTGPINGDYPVSVTSGTETWKNPITGNGNIAKGGGATLELAGANGTFTGTITVGNGTLRVSASQACGTATIKPTYKDSRIVFAAADGVFPNDIQLAANIQTSGDDGKQAIRFEKNTKLTGNITSAYTLELGLQKANKPKVEYWGTVTKSSPSYCMNVVPQGINEFHGKVVCKSPQLDYSGYLNLAQAWSGNGVVRFYSPENEIGRIRMYTAAVECMAENVLNNTAFCWEHTDGGLNSDGYQVSSIYMNSYSQRIMALESKLVNISSYPTGNGAEICSTAPVTLTILGHPMTGGEAWICAAVSHMRIADQVSVVVDAQEYPEFVQTFTNRAHTTSGDLIASNGTLRIAGTATFANVKRVCVAAGGTFRQDSTADGALSGVTSLEVDGKFIVGNGCKAGFSDAGIALSVGPGAEIYFAEREQINVASLRVDGKDLPSGVYDSDNLPQLKRGCLRIQPTPSSARWTGNGGEDTSVDNAANWNASPVDLVTGGLTATFADGGDTATVADSAAFNDLSFVAASGKDGFTFVKGGASARVSMIGSSMSFAAGEAAHRYAFELPFGILGIQTVSLTLPDADTLRFGGGLVVRNGSVDVKGQGTVVLNGESVIGGAFMRERGSGVTLVSGTLATPGHVDQGAAEDGGAMTLTIGTTGGNYNTVQGLVVSNAVIEKPVYMKAAMESYAVRALAGTTNAFTGQLRQYWAWSGLWLEKNSETVVEGGLVSADAAFRPGGDGHLIFRGKPFRTVASTGLTPCRNAWVTIDSTGNQTIFASIGVDNGTSGKIEFTKSNAFDWYSRYNCNWPVLLAGMYFTDNSHFVQSTVRANSVFEFNSTTQRVNAAAGGPLSQFHGAAGSMLVLTGRQGADYFIDTDANRKGLRSENNVLSTPFEGALSLRMEGTGTLTVTNNLSGTSGSLQVASGEIRFTHDSAWTNVFEVAVSGTGVLTFERCRRPETRRTFAKTSVWRLSDSGKVKLLAGIQQRASELWVDGAKMPDGIYTHASAPAELKAHLDAGSSGAFIVGDLGFSVIIR